MIIDGYLEKGVVLSMEEGIKPSEILAFEKGLDKSKLIKRYITDSRGHRTARWVRVNPNEKEEGNVSKLKGELDSLRAKMDRVADRKEEVQENLRNADDFDSNDQRSYWAERDALEKEMDDLHDQIYDVKEAYLKAKLDSRDTSSTPAESNTKGNGGGGADEGSSKMSDHINGLSAVSQMLRRDDQNGFASVIDRISNQIKEGGNKKDIIKKLDRSYRRADQDGLSHKITNGIRTVMEGLQG